MRGIPQHRPLPDYRLDPPEDPDPVRCPVCREPDACWPGEPSCEDCAPADCEVCNDEHPAADLVAGFCAGDLLGMEDSGCVEFW